MKIKLSETIVEGSEKIREGSELLKGYFYHFFSHCCTYLLMPNSAYFFCRSILNVNVIKTINIPAATNLDSVFYDWRLNEVIQSDNGAKAIKILVNSGFAGYYLIKQNILFATDWTHDKETIKIFREILPTLIRELELELKKRKSSSSFAILTLGADPEFELVLNGRVVEASQYFPFEGQIGLDSARDQVEFRPEPGGTPQELVRNFKKLLKRFRKEHDKFSLSYGGNFYPLAGHIHIGLSVPIERRVYELVKEIDKKIGSLVKYSGLARGCYVRKRLYELKDYGFEYKPLPAAVFSNPRVLKIILKVIVNVVKDYFGGKIRKLKEILTMDEIKYLLRERRRWVEEPNCSLFAGWRIKDAKTKPKPKIYFSDEWDQTLVEAILRLAENSRLLRKVQVELYGLAKYRGKVNTVRIKGYGVIPHPKSVSEDGVVIGLARCLRVNVEDVEATARMIVKVMKREVKKFLKKFKAIRRF
ncbi:MAG: hypothetical protein QXF06_05435 [Archaeoglobaceae archaeon]